MGHPDKIADQVADAILDAIYQKDPDARVACEVLVTTGLTFVAGEITTSCYVDIPQVARTTIRDIGYTDPVTGFDYQTCAVISAIHEQSQDISRGVTEGEGLHKEQGAGDQGVMIGYACNETPELMPMPIMLARKLTDGLAHLRESGKLPYLRPDGKSQVTVEYDGARPVRVHTVVVSTQHGENVDYKTIRKDLLEKLIKEVIPPKMLDAKTVCHINPTGRFVTGGPMGDTGLTGRKNIVDTYGGRGSHGGGCFSGKDPTKVDRSASYMARYIAKNVVAAGLADCCEMHLSYAIGVADPLSLYIDTEGTAQVSPRKIHSLVQKHFPLRPKEIIDYLKLKRPIYLDTARYGHFGRDSKSLTWERTDLAETLRKEAGLPAKAEKKRKAQQHSQERP
jgi:S-adenosylmethionine synthetase